MRDRIEGGKTLESLQDLEPVFQEVLCAEFLRLPTKKTGLPQLAHLTMPVGRTMEDLDVWGIDANGRPIIAQVTFGPSAQRPAKVANLKKYAEQGTTLIYFCGDENESKRDGIHFFPMKKAYDIFISQASGRQWLKEISG